MSKFYELEQYANAQLQIHGLSEGGWTFSWNNRKRTFGLCVYTKKEIQLSRHMVSSGEPIESMKGTVRHEIAHALVGPGHGHDRVWQRKAMELGVSPQRCRSKSFEEKTYRWYYVCHECKHRTGFFRKPRVKYRRSCGQCNPHQFDKRYVLSLVPA